MPDRGELARRSTAALKWAYVGAAARVLAQLVIQVFLARLLGPTAMGQAALVMLVVGFGWLLADAGFGAALVQRERLHDDDVAYALGCILLVASGMSLLVLLTAPWIAQALGDASSTNLIRACAVLLPLQALSNIPASLMRRDLDMRRQQTVQVMSYVLGYGVFGVALAYLGLGPWSLVIGFGVQTAMALIWGYLIVRHTLKPTLRGDRSLRQFGLGVMGTNLANWAIDNLDRAVVGRFWSSDGLGNYAAAANLSRAPMSMLVSSAQSVVFATASRVQGDRRQLAVGFLGALNLATLLTFPLFCLLGMHADSVIHLLYGQRWQEAAPLFAAFCVAVPCSVILSIAGPVLWAAGRASSEMKIQIVVAIALVLGLSLLAGQSLAVAVWIVPLLYAMRALFVVGSLRRQAHFAWREVLHALLAGGLLSAVIATASAALPGEMDAFVRLLASALISFCVSLLLLRLGGHWLLAPSLVQALAKRAAASGLARYLCACFGLRPEAQP